MRLSHLEITNFDLHISENQPFKAILISDLHIGQYQRKHASLLKLMENLRLLIEQHHPTHIFILGDIVSFKIYNIFSDWLKVYNTLEELNIEIHVIPGNHDRYQHKLVMVSFNGHFVHLHPDELIRIIPEWEEKIVCLGHDLHNDSKVHERNLVREWISLLRTTFSNLIPSNALLILGHLHDPYKFDDLLCQTILPFSDDLHSYQYGILENVDNVLTLNLFFMEDHAH